MMNVYRVGVGVGGTNYLRWSHMACTAQYTGKLAVRHTSETLTARNEKKAEVSGVPTSTREILNLGLGTWLAELGKAKRIVQCFETMHILCDCSRTLPRSYSVVSLNGPERGQFSAQRHHQLRHLHLCGAADPALAEHFARRHLQRTL